MYFFRAIREAWPGKNERNSPNPHHSSSAKFHHAREFLYNILFPDVKLTSDQEWMGAAHCIIPRKMQAPHGKKRGFLPFSFGKLRLALPRNHVGNSTSDSDVIKWRNWRLDRGRRVPFDRQRERKKMTKNKKKTTSPSASTSKRNKVIRNSNGVRDCVCIGRKKTIV